MVYADASAPVKWSVLKVRNTSGRFRRMSATGYVEWVLGDLRAKTAPHVVTSIDPGTGAVVAQNQYNAEFAGRAAFFHVDDASRRVTGDRTEFLGRNGTLKQPAAMTRATLSGRVGGALDPCAAIQVPFVLDDGQEREFVFRLGAGRDVASASALLGQLLGGATARASLEAVWAVLEPHAWRRQHRHARRVAEHTGERLARLPDDHVPPVGAQRLVPVRGRVRVPGSTAGCDGARPRRSATGPAAPAPLCVTAVSGGRRAALVASAGWPRCPHTLLGRLPVAATGHVPLRDGHRRHRSPRRNGSFRRGSSREPGGGLLLRHARRWSEEAASLYGHCVRAIVRSLKFGDHGLPLIGSGDWNDGMNLVGAAGRGESVWLGFFLYALLVPFAGLARRHGDTAFSDRCLAEAAALRLRLEAAGWDGSWYRRAYFDDGSPLGSSTNAECQIDSIAQSWSVLSGAADRGPRAYGDGGRRRAARPPK